MPADPLPAFERALDAALGRLAEPGLAAAARHLPAAGGKRLRPILAILACQATGGDALQALPAAVAVELVHTFSLVHDDLMDEDLTRRGRPTVHAAFGPTHAILAGDALFALAFEALAVAPEGSAPVLAKAALGLCEGQALDMRFEREWPTVEAYVAMVELKTGALFGAALALGSIAAGSQGRADALDRAGRDLGIAFQVQDDLLDLTAEGEVRGKDRGMDLRRGKRTLPVVLAHQGDASAWSVVERNLGLDKPDPDAVVAALRGAGILDEAAKTARRHYQRATAVLQTLPDSSGREALLQRVGAMEARSR